jgi:tripartite-type tricarboxylate transporter receptor subunit TctC
MGKSPLAFYAMTSSKINTPQELINEVRAGKRPINFAVGGAAHKLAVEYFVAGVNQGNKDTVETALYKGPAQAAQDVVANQVEFGVFPIAVGHPHVEAGRIKLLGLTGEVKMPGLEKAPLMKDFVPGLNVYACWNLMLPKGTSSDVQKWYHDAFVDAIRTQEVKELYEKNFIFISPNEFTAEGIRDSMRKLRQQWQPFAAKIKPE